MAEWIKPMQWDNEGVEPSENLRSKGFEAKYKPPAPIFNYFLHREQECIEQLQEEVDKTNQDIADLASNTESKFSEVDERFNEMTPDSEKSVKFASEAGVARKAAYPLTVRFNGGSTEGTDKWTFDGSTSRSINITPEKIKAANKEHAHTLDEVSETEEKKIKRVVTATSTDGVAYTATVEGVTELYNGMEITIIPDTRSTSKTITLNINGLGAVNVRQPLSFSTFVATAPDRDYFLYENTPCRLMYHANYANGGIWLMADKQKTSAQDLYGIVPVENGGTGHNSVDTTPTKDSTKMVTSGGVYDAVESARLKLTEDSYYYTVPVGNDAEYKEIGTLSTGKRYTDIIAVSFKYNDSLIHGIGTFYYVDYVASDVMGISTTGIMYRGVACFKQIGTKLYMRFSTLTSFNIGTGVTSDISSTTIENINVIYR